jgi:hypothetical protein
MKKANAPVVVCTTRKTTTSGMLPVFAYTSMTG